MSSATDDWTNARALEYFDQLPPGLRDDPATSRVMAALFQAIASVDVVVRNRAMGLRDLLDPRFVAREEFLPLIGTLVGFDRGLGLTSFMDAAMWRKLLPFAGDIWRQKGIGYRALITAFTGRPLWVGYWHELRNQTDISPLPWSDVSADGAPDYHERSVRIHLPDPVGNWPSYTPGVGEAAADRAVVESAVEALRPVQQRVDLYWFDTVDEFSQGLSRWSVLSGTVTADESALAMTVKESSSVSQSWGDVQDEFDYATWEVTLKRTGDAVFDVWVRYDSAADEGWLTRVTPATGGWELFRTDGTSVATGTHAVPDGAFFKLTITSAYETIGDQDRCTVYLDADLVLDGIAATPTDESNGPVRLTTSASVELEVLLVEQYQTPITPTRVGPA